MQSDRAPFRVLALLAVTVGFGTLAAPSSLASVPCSSSADALYRHYLETGNFKEFLERAREINDLQATRTAEIGRAESSLLAAHETWAAEATAKIEDFAATRGREIDATVKAGFKDKMRPLIQEKIRRERELITHESRLETLTSEINALEMKRGFREKWLFGSFGGNRQLVKDRASLKQQLAEGVGRKTEMAEALAKFKTTEMQQVRTEFQALRGVEYGKIEAERGRLTAEQQRRLDEIMAPRRAFEREVGAQRDALEQEVWAFLTKDVDLYKQLQTARAKIKDVLCSADACSSAVSNAERRWNDVLAAEASQELFERMNSGSFVDTLSKIGAASARSSFDAAVRDANSEAQRTLSRAREAAEALRRINTSVPETGLSSVNGINPWTDVILSVFDNRAGISWHDVFVGVSLIDSSASLGRLGSEVRDLSTSHDRAGREVESAIRRFEESFKETIRRVQEG